MLKDNAAYSRCAYPMVSCDASPLLALLATAVLVVDAARRLEHSRCTFCSTCKSGNSRVERSAARSAVLVSCHSSVLGSVPATAQRTEA